MAKLNIMVGLPGSGKSHYARGLLQNVNNLTLYLSSDDIRVDMFGFEDQAHNAEVFKEMRNETISALKDGIDVVYDATNLGRKRRKDIISRAKALGAEVNAYLCCTPINMLLERNFIRPERRLPWDKLVQMIRSIEPPMYYEGFDNIYLINGGSIKHALSYDIDDKIKFLKSYKQDNPYHEETLGEHIIAVTKKAEEFGKTLSSKDDASVLRQASIWHDAGKPFTKEFSEDKGYSTYYGHERVSTYLYLCHVYTQAPLDDLKRARLEGNYYATSILILNHMEWCRREDMEPVREAINDDRLYHLLELLHEADEWGRGDNAKKERGIKNGREEN